MDHLQALTGATEYFDFNPRRFVGHARRSIRSVPAAEGMKSWDLWVSQALAALVALHDAGFIHCSIDPSALVVNEDGNLRLGGLQKVMEESVGSPATAASDPFHPNNLSLPPEQNLRAAFLNAVPFQGAFQTLQQVNWPQDQIETVFPAIRHSRPAMFGLYELVQSLPAYKEMAKAGDVWMLGFALLSVYYEWLEWPYAASSEFYQTRHEAFHDVIEQMVRVNPKDRITAEEALRIWAPQEVHSTGVESVGSTVPAEPLTSTAVATAVATAAPVVEKRRPYLTLQSHSAGRNKTRRSPRS